MSNIVSVNPSQRTILRIDSSARYTGSQSRELASRLVEVLAGEGPNASRVVTRDLAASQPEFIDEAWIGASFTDPDARTPEQKARLAVSDALVDELEAADILVIGAPIYNFGVPAALKAWVDQVARARRTFKYTETGPVGLLTGKKAYVIVTSGGVPVGSEVDYASRYLKQVLGFLGIHDVTVIVAERLNFDADAAIAAALAQIAAAGVEAAAA